MSQKVSVSSERACFLHDLYAALPSFYARFVCSEKFLTFTDFLAPLAWRLLFVLIIRKSRLVPDLLLSE